MSSDVVIAVLDCLVPGDTDGWPAAGQHGLAPKMLELLETLSVYGHQQLAIFLSQLPENFPALSTEKQIEILKTIELSNPDSFETILKACYSAYYTDPEIRRILELKTGYEARPPQPLGYDMLPFDESLLEPVRARGPIWRKVR